MIQTQLVFKTDYRFDLKRIKSVIIPYLFDNEASLVISVEAKSYKKSRDVGTVDQSLIDYPDKLIASSQLLQLGNQEIQFPQKGRFRLIFYPNYSLGKTTIKILKLLDSPINAMAFNIQVSTEPVVLLASKPRLGATFLNKSDSVLLIDFATDVDNNIGAVEILPGGYYELPYSYTGIVSGQLIVGEGIAVVREFI